jgi:hypothetical protein
MAEENHDWGYRRIQGTLANLGNTVARSTIVGILRRHGIEPVPERKRQTSPCGKKCVRRLTLSAPHPAGSMDQRCYLLEKMLT